MNIGTALAIIAGCLLFPVTYCQGEETTCDSQGNDERRLPDYLIIGAGGSGLQMALFLEKFNHSYIILEKEDKVGSFWSTFPRFRELISVNKWVRNETQRLRFDWHSMLEAPVQMRDVTEDYFPHGDDYQLYMKRVAEEAKLKIEFGAEVESLATDGTPCVTLRGGSRRCSKHRVFVGTGLREKSEPYLQALGGIPYSRMTKEMAYHRRVCILGNGNSGFEVAHNVVQIADRVVMYGHHPHRFSSVTRYTGDVRVKFAQALENFHGKLLDTVDHMTQRPILKGPERTLPKEKVENLRDMLEAASFLNQFNCETFVLATGFRSYVPGVDLRTRFPPTNDWYAWTKNSKIHFIGWLMHEADFRMGAGGFFSGYRYLIRNLVHHVRDEDFGIAYPFEVLTKEQVIDHTLSRVQTASDLVILQDAVTVKDVIVKDPSQSDEEDLYHYYEGITYKFHNDLGTREEAMSLFFAWGDSRRSSRVFENVIRYNDTGKLINVFLHPVIEVNGLTRNIQEDVDMEWLGLPFVSAVLRTARAALDKDLALFQPRKRYPYKREAVNYGDGPRDYESCGVSPAFEIPLLKAITKAAQSDGMPQDLEELRKAAAQWLPEVVAASSIA